MSMYLQHGNYASKITQSRPNQSDKPPFPSKFEDEDPFNLNSTNDHSENKVPNQNQVQNSKLRLPSSRISSSDLSTKNEFPSKLNRTPHTVKEKINMNRQARNIQNLTKNIKKCPKNFIDTTHKTFPISKGVYKSSGMDFAVLIESFPSNDVETPLINASTEKDIIVRCSRCRAYINPFAVFDTDSSYICNFCGGKNELPDYYECALDEEGKRKDIKERPELNSCFYEFLAPLTYANRPPQVPVYFFLIDVSAEACETGVLANICAEMTCAMAQLSKNPRSMVVIITFDVNVHFYCFKPSEDGTLSPEIFVSSDANSLCVPPIEETLVSVSDHFDSLCDFFDRLPEMHRHDKRSASALGFAVIAIKTAYKSIGGKILLFAVETPSLNPGKVESLSGELMAQIRQQSVSEKTGSKPSKKSEAIIKALKMLITDSSGFYTENAGELNLLQFSVDVFFFSKPGATLNSAAVGQLSARTGGRITVFEMAGKKYDGEPKENMFKTLSGEIMMSVSQEKAWEAVMRLRVSRKVEISNQFGCFELKNRNLICFPVTSAGRTVAVSLKFSDDEEEPIIFGSLLFLQSALLYTSEKGERKIRVYNAAIPTATSARQFADSINVKPYVAYVTKCAAEKALNNVNFNQARSFVQNFMIRPLHSMVANKITLSRSKSPLEEIDADTRDAAIRCLAILKSTAFKEASLFPFDLKRNRSHIPPQFRYQHLHYLKHASVSEIDLYTKPKCFSLLDVLCSDDFPGEEVKDSAGLEEQILDVIEKNSRPLNTLAFVGSPVLVLCNANIMVLRVRADCDQEVLKVLFARKENGELELSPAKDSVLGVRLQKLRDYLRGRVPGRHFGENVLMESKENDESLEQLLFEERSESVMSLDEFLRYIVKVVNTKL